MNNDSIEDLIVGSLVDSSLNVFFGENSSSLFSPKIRIEVSIRPLFIVSGDLNGDFSVDLIVSNNEDGMIEVFLNSGFGSFSVSQRNVTNSRIQDVELSDVNSDGRLDLAVTTVFPNELLVFFGLGTGSFVEEIRSSVKFLASRSIFVDLNSDSKVDAIFLFPLEQIFGFSFGYGNGSFGAVRRKNLNFSPLDFLVSPDFVFFFIDAETRRIFSVFPRWKNNFSRQKIVRVSRSARVFDLAAADFDSDGRTDLLSSNFGTNDLSIFLGSNSSRKVFRRAEFFSNFDASKPREVFYGNFRSPSRLEFGATFFREEKISIFIASKNFTEIRPSVANFLSFHSSPQMVSVADFDGNFLDDFSILFGAENRIEFFSPTNFSVFQRKETFFAEFYPTEVRAVDFDNDATTDLVVFSILSRSARFFISKNDKNFSAGNSFFFDRFFRSIFFENFFGPNFNDFLLVFDGILFVSIFSFDLHGNKTERNIFPRNPFLPNFAVVANFDENSGRDFLLFYQNQTIFSAFYNQRNGTFKEKIFNVSRRVCYRAATRDFNRDKIFDVALLDGSKRELTILLAEENHNFRLVNTIRTDFNVFLFEFFDLNNDGLFDLIFLHESRPIVTIFIALNDSQFSQPIESPAPAQSLSVAFADFNQDRQIDMIIGNYQDQTLEVFFGKIFF